MVNAIFTVVQKYDDPVGIWYICQSCNKESFVPDFDFEDKETKVFKYCPYCGKEITKIIDL